jgi:RNA polymerase sigma-70 factor (ECF subfamily)
VGTALTLNARPDEIATGIAEEQFDEIVRQHQRRVYRVMFLLVRNADAADVLTQECFVRAFEKRSSFRGECRIDTWLLKIAVNLVRDHARSRRASFWKRLVGLADGNSEELPNDFPDHGPSPERTVIARRQLEAVWALAAELPERQKTIFLLRFAEELELADIAHVLGLKVGSVKTHLFRAVNAVREKLKEQQWT